MRVMGAKWAPVSMRNTGSLGTSTAPATLEQHKTQPKIRIFHMAAPGYLAHQHFHPTVARFLYFVGCFDQWLTLAPPRRLDAVGR